MHHLTVEDMTCGHCAATVEKAVKAADARPRWPSISRRKPPRPNPGSDPMYSSLRLKTLVTGRPSRSPAAATSIDPRQPKTIETQL